MKILEELKRRNVFRVAVAYVVTGWLLIQALELAADSFEAPAWVMKMIITVVALGFIPALLFSWAFELTPEGFRRERDVPRDASVSRHTGRRLNYVTVVSALGVLGLFSWQQFLPPDSAPAALAIQDGVLALDADKTIAVLPFLNMSADADNEYFSDGIAEELLNGLVRVAGLQVASRTSAFSFKNKNVDIPTVAESLRVDHIVEGSVRRAGNQVRITAQLIDVRTDRHLWSETYTRELKDVFAIQSEIATEIAAALQLTLLGETAKRQTDNLEAYDLYLLGRHHFHQRTPVSLPKAIDLFEQVIALDPGYAPAYSGLADAYNLVFQYGEFDPQTAMSKGSVNARKAVELDPMLAEAHASLGLSLAVRNELETARGSYRRAIELNPDYSMAHMWLGTSLSTQPIKALAAFRAAERVDPLHPVIAENIGGTLITMGRYDEGARQLEHAIDTNPESVLLYMSLSRLEFDRGDLAAAYRAARQAVAIDPRSPLALSAMAHGEMDLGNFDAAEYWLRRLEQAVPGHRAIGEVEFGLAEARGDLDAAERTLDSRLTETQDSYQSFILQWAAALKLRRGYPDEALAMQASLDKVYTGNAGYLLTLALRALARHQLNETDRAMTIAEEGLALAGDLRAAGIDQPWLSDKEAIFLEVLGRRTQALDKVQAGFDNGLRNIYGFSTFWMLDAFFGEDPRYLKIRRETNADVERQQAIIAAELEACGNGSSVCKLAILVDEPPAAEPVGL